MNEVLFGQSNMAVGRPVRRGPAGQSRSAGRSRVVFADYGIPNPTFGPVSTEDHGVVEFLVSFTKSS